MYIKKENTKIKTNYCYVYINLTVFLLQNTLRPHWCFQAFFKSCSFTLKLSQNCREKVKTTNNSDSNRIQDTGKQAEDGDRNTGTRIKRSELQCDTNKTSQ